MTNLYPLLTVALGLSLFGSNARAGEFRKLSLIDGRVLHAEILSTEAEGLMISLPQGQTLVEFELLLDMAPMDEASYKGQNPWIVYVNSPEGAKADLPRVFDALPSTVVIGRPDAEGVLNEEQQATIEACAGDHACLRAVAEDMKFPWLWYVDAQPAGAGFLFKSGVSQGDEVFEATAVNDDLETLWVAAREALRLNTDAKLPKALKVPEGVEKPPKEKVAGQLTEAQVNSLAFAPVPGLPSFIGKDSGNGLAAVATVVPGTVLWFGAVGKNAQSAGEGILLGVGGFYALTVGANHFFGMRSLSGGAGDVSVTVTPTEGGGTALGIAVER